MMKLTIHLPKKHRVDLRLVKSRRTKGVVTLFPDFKAILNTRRGNKVSRYFRHVFEHKNIRRLLGMNLVMVSLVSSFIPTTKAFSESDVDTTYQVPVVIKTEKQIQYPLEKVVITQTYKFYHPGLDLNGVTGDPVKPIKAGIVTEVHNSRFGYGKYVLVRHEEGLHSLYAHLSEISVEEGNFVSMDDEVGKLGATGRAFGDHLHLEIYKDGKTVNPLSILPPQN